MSVIDKTKFYVEERQKQAHSSIDKLLNAISEQSRLLRKIAVVDDGDYNAAFNRVKGVLTQINGYFGEIETWKIVLDEAMRTKNATDAFERNGVTNA